MNEQDITKDGWPVAQLKIRELVIRAVTVHPENNSPQVDETTLGQENDVAAALHGVAVDLRLDVDGLLGVRLQPGDIDLNIEVADAAELIRAGATNVQ